MTYVAYNANHEQVNIVEIEPAQIASWEALTGLTLELREIPQPTDEVEKIATYEAALTELGVNINEE